MMRARPSPECRLTPLVVGCFVLFAGSAISQEAGPSFNAFGTPGLIDTPSAQPAADGLLSTTIAHVNSTTRTTLSFQMTPRLSGSFRYSAFHDFNHPDSVDGVYFDRSFDLRYLLVKEGRYRPAVTVGLQDFVGTGQYGGEYIVASKTVAPGLTLTGGLGWGRFGEGNNRAAQFEGEGGSLAADIWFQDNIGYFGGISYSPNDRLTFKAEYSSDTYDEETLRQGFTRNSPWNLGIDYRTKGGTQYSLYYTNGDTLGAQITLFSDPKTSAAPGGVAPAPQPVAVRSAAQRQDLGWTNIPAARPAIRDTLAKSLAAEGITLEGLDVSGHSATARISNTRYLQGAQAIGRTARVMTRTLPGSIETLTIIPTTKGVAASAVTIQRSDLEQLEHQHSDAIYARSQITDAFDAAPGVSEGLYPQFKWSLSPTLKYGFFDPNAPLRADLRLKAKASFAITPNLVLAGSVSQKLLGNLDQADRESNSVLPHVRSDAPLYAQEGQFAMDQLTLSHYGRPAQNFYSRVTLGYLETMYAGVSTELLWKPVGSRLALGVELNYVRQRDFDQGFGVQDYDVLTGHASAYYSFGNGYHGQLDIGRYLAGDYGATLSVDREFSNGWKVGAFATFTDVSFEDFGEGSFDKGVRITVPLGALTGQPSQHDATLNLRPIQRDGGARVNVPDRLYENIRPYHQPDMATTWGKFWR